jgi:hypothetical protein
MPCLQFENQLGRRARVWLDDLPGDALLPNETIRENHVFESGAATALWKSVAIEIFQPFGASFHYGLLGGEYQLTDTSGLEIIVPVDTPFPERHYIGALSRSLDIVSVGGLPEYASAICTGIEQVNVGVRPCGILNLTCMAHGKIGSAPSVFTSLARALIHALCRTDRPSSLEEAMALLSA